MARGNRIISLYLLFAVACVHAVHAASPNHAFIKQGYSLKVQMSNVGTFGRIAYPPFTAFPYPPEDSIGVEYFLGEPAEHVWGAGLCVLGREVATLVNERLSPRRYARVWDASGLSSGVYYVRLTAGDFSAVRKLVLVR